MLSRHIEGADRAFLGIVYVGVNTDYFESIYASVQSINSLLFTLVRKDGIILFRYPSSTGDAGRKLSAEAAWLNALSSGQTGFRILAQNDGQVRFVSSRAVAQYPLFVNTSVTEISALAVWRTRATAIGIGSAVLLLCSTGLLIAVGRQVRRLRSSEARLAYLAHYDLLTDLAGRALFSINLDAAVAQMARTGDRFAIFMIDLDDFKAVNDTCGHGAGDALLRTVGGRLQSAVGGAGLVARLGGDEFAVLAPLSKNESQCADLARRILQETVRPCDLGEMEFVVGLSIGIAIAPRDGTDAVALMKNADAALYASKSSGRNRFSFFSPPAHAEPHDGDDLAPSLQPAQQENPSAAEVA